MSHWFDQIAPMPLVAILRGLAPEDAPAVGQTLERAALAANTQASVLIGAGTVLTPAQVEDVAQAGGRIIVSPNMNPSVIRRTKALGLISLPGIATPTEAFAALDAGADGLKLFPAEMHSPAVLKAMKAVLPPDIPVFAVGGIGPDNLCAWRRAGADGFGIGSSLFSPGIALAELDQRAMSLTEAWRAST